MSEHPILFSGPMVQALLDGRKTQTRRIVKPQPPREYISATYDDVEKGWWWNDEHALSAWPWESKVVNGLYSGPKVLRCPCGAPGEKLWVRETFQLLEWFGDHWEPAKLRHAAQSIHKFYQADVSLPDQDGLSWRPSIHMPRWASRLTLEITDIRVERLQDISEEDAKAEGIEQIVFDDPFGRKWRNYFSGKPEAFSRPWDSFRSLWESINGCDCWNQNPWVWVVSFKKI